MTAPLLSVVIPTRNRARWLAGALASIDRTAGTRLQVEKIVVDDGSTDDTAAVAEKYGARLLLSPRRGASAARNTGMAAATGEFLLFLDDDDELLPDHLGPHLEMLRRDPTLDAVFGQVQLADQQMEPFGDPYPEVVEAPFHQMLNTWQQIGSVVVRTAVRETVGPFDESLSGSQDWDWLLRLSLRHEVAFVPVPCLLFRQRPAGGDDALNYRRLEHMRRAFWLNVRRAGERRPPLRALLGMYTRHNGNFAGHFLDSLEAHAARGDAAASRGAVRGALASSPLHVAAAVARRPRLLTNALRPYLLPAMKSLDAPEP
jgi:glycosyltransferase involved in cell wall biosynthesis